MIKLKIIKYSILIFATITVSACTSFGYYVDLMSGHSDLLEQRKPVSDLLADKGTSPKLRKLLEKSQNIRNFATKSLHLPENESYRHYADLKRPYAVWNVIAAKEFSVEAKKWCFLFVGCLSYKGYFSEKEASEQASELEKQGYDVHVAGARAYSTLGWFDDPLLNTMMYRSEARRAGIIFHELAHQVLYIENDTAFNEAFATVVEHEGIRRWLKANNKEKEFENYLFDKKRDQQINALLLKTQKKLKDLYKTKATDKNKRREKQKLFALIQSKYEQLKKTWKGKNINDYDGWMQKGLNNSHLLLIATYYDLVPKFKAILKEEKNDLKRFYIRVKSIGQLNKKERMGKLNTENKTVTWK